MEAKGHCLDSAIRKPLGGVTSELDLSQIWMNKIHEDLKEVFVVAAAAKSLQSCPTLCDPIDSSPPGSPIPEILQAGTLEWVAISFSNAWKWKVKVKSFSRVWLLATPWTAASQAPPSTGFSRQEHWSGVPLPSLEVFFRRMQRPWGRTSKHLILSNKFFAVVNLMTVKQTLIILNLYFPVY